MAEHLKEPSDENRSMPHDANDKLRRLRIEIDKGLRSLDAGEGSELDIQEVITQARLQNEKG